MSDVDYRLVDLGDRRVLTVDGREHSTAYSDRVVRMLIERKGPRRAALYFPFKQTRGRHVLSPLFRYLRGLGAGGLSVLEVGCSFGHITECLAEAPEVAELYTFDTDPAFVAITRAKVEEMGLKAVREVAACPTRTRASTSCWRSGWSSTCRRGPGGRRWTNTTACWRPGGTSRSWTRRTAPSRWRRTRSGCPWSSGCRRDSPTATRASGARPGSATSPMTSSSPTGRAGATRRSASACPHRAGRVSKT